MKSILTLDMEHCVICGSPNVEIHHVFGGPNRKNSDKYGLVVPLCHRHHNEPPAGVHHNEGSMLALQADAQAVFESIESHEDFMRVFGRDYIETYKDWLQEHGKEVFEHWLKENKNE